MHDMSNKEAALQIRINAMIIINALVQMPAALPDKAVHDAEEVLVAAAPEQSAADLNLFMGLTMQLLAPSFSQRADIVYNLDQSAVGRDYQVVSMSAAAVSAVYVSTVNLEEIAR